MHGKARFGSKFVLSGLIKVLEIEIGDYSGDWLTIEALIEHRTFNHVGFGVGFYFNDLEATRETLRGAVLTDVGIEATGIALFVRFNT